MGIALPAKCEEVLSAKVCEELRTVARKLKLKAKQVDALVRRAVEAKVTEAKAIIKEVRSGLEALSNIKCEDVLSAEVCATIKTLAGLLKVKAAKVDQAIRVIVAKGVIRAKEILDMIKQRLFPAMSDEEFLYISVGKCEDILAEKVCGDLRRAAEKLKLKVEEVDVLVREAVKAKITEATAIAEHVRQSIVKMALNFKCQDVLPARVCDTIVEVAKVIQVKASAVDHLIKEIVASGVTEVREIMRKIREKLFPVSL